MIIWLQDPFQMNFPANPFSFPNFLKFMMYRYYRLFICLLYLLQITPPPFSHYLARSLTLTSYYRFALAPVDFGLTLYQDRQIIYSRPRHIRNEYKREQLYSPNSPQSILRCQYVIHCTYHYHCHSFPPFCPHLLFQWRSKFSAIWAPFLKY